MDLDEFARIKRGVMSPESNLHAIRIINTASLLRRTIAIWIIDSYPGLAVRNRWIRVGLVSFPTLFLRID